MVTIYTTCLRFKNSEFNPYSIHVFHMIISIVTWLSDYIRGLVLEHLQNVTTKNYDSLTELLQRSL
jgi:dolichol kinase